MRIFKINSVFQNLLFLATFFIYMLCDVVMVDVYHMLLCLRTVSRKNTHFFPVYGHSLSKRAERDVQDCHGARVQISTSLVIPNSYCEL